MRISFSPQRRDDSLEVSKAGDVLTIKGQVFDFSSLPDGGAIPAGEVPCEWITGPVERVGGELHLTLILPHGANPSAAVAFPAEIVGPTDGPIAVPFDAPAMEEPADVDG
jgi:hypothetical protein